MVFVNSVPVGFLQFHDSLQNGQWHTRTPEFVQQPTVALLEWSRLPGDLLFIIGGILPVVYLALRMFTHRNRPATVAVEESAGEFIERPTT
jgi:nitric oxide reductase subunit B